MSLFKGRIDNSPQDQHTAPFKFTLIRYDKEDITLTAPALADANKINVSTGHGFTANDDIVLYENGLFNQSIVKAVNGNEITTANFLDKNYSLSAKVVRGNRFMNVDGSSVPVTFKFKCYENIIPIDLYRIILNFQSGASKPDDSTFGGITALANGIVMRRIYGAYRNNFGNFCSNKSFKDYGAEVVDTDKGTSGTYGTDITIKITDYGVAIRIGYVLNEELTLLVRDNLTALGLFTVSLIGHYTMGEV